MNRTRYFRYYLAFLLLTLLSLAVRIQSATGPVEAKSTNHATDVAQLSALPPQ